MLRNTRRKYISGERIFRVNMNNTDDRGYYEVSEENERGIFYLPDYIIDGMVYVFSWDRYEEEYDAEKALIVLNKELNTSTSIKAQQDLMKFIENTEYHIISNNFIEIS